MNMRPPGTLEQIPESAAVYREKSVAGNGAYKYQPAGRDSLGREVFDLLWFDGEPTGQQRALIPFRAYVAKVKEFAKLSSSIGVQRWTTPYYNEVV